MTAIETVLRQPAAQAMGWTLLHFLWQGTLVAGLTAVALALLRRHAADVRYVVATAALALMITLPAVTWRSVSSRADRSEPPTAAALDGVRTDAAAGRPEGSPRPSTGVRTGTVSSVTAPWGGASLESWMPMLVLAWLCGVATLTLRLLSGWVYVQRLKSLGTSPASEAWQRAGARLAKQLHIRRPVRLLQSTGVDVPTVIGWIKPVVLLPIGALAGLSAQQFEAVLAHELAHVRRHDYLVNLLQTLVETLFFYHPAVWWLSRRIRVERENCCDDLAVSLCGDPYAYATALADLEQSRGRSGHFALAATDGSLLQRVRRLLNPVSHAGAPGWRAGVATGALILAILAGAAGTDVFEAAPANVAPAAPSTRAAMVNRLEQNASFYRGAAAVAAQIEALTGHASTPILSARPLMAKADAFSDAARLMAAKAGTSDLALAIPAASVPLAPEAPAPVSTLAHSAGTKGVDRPGLEDPIAGSAGADKTAELTAQSGTVSVRRTNQTMSWSNNGQRLEVRIDGEVEFSDDDSDVTRLSPGGLLRIKDGRWLATHTLEYTADGSGGVTRRYWSGLTEQPFDPDGRRWAAQMLPTFIRQTGIGAASRVARFLKKGGPGAVLTEIGLIEGSYGKRIYFKELLAQGSLDTTALRQVLAQAGREINSDFELASLLIDSADRLLTADDTVRQAYFDAARSIDSDFEMRRVYSAALKRGPVTPALLAGILDASRGIDSDFEEASLLIQIAKLQPLDKTTRAPFFAALTTVASDFEHRRVLSALAERSDLPVEVTASMLESGATIGSDFEAASFLLQVVRQQPIEGPLREPFFRAVNNIGSAFERGRVLKAVAGRADTSSDTVLATLRAARTMDSGFEASQVLLALAAAHAITGPSRDAYIDAAEKLGDFEQGKVLSALVRSERRR